MLRHFKQPLVVKTFVLEIWHFVDKCIHIFSCNLDHFLFRLYRLESTSSSSAWPDELGTRTSWAIELSYILFWDQADIFRVHYCNLVGSFSRTIRPESCSHVCVLVTFVGEALKVSFGNICLRSIIAALNFSYKRVQLVFRMLFAGLIGILFLWLVFFQLFMGN